MPSDEAGFGEGPQPRLTPALSPRLCSKTRAGGPAPGSPLRAPSGPRLQAAHGARGCSPLPLSAPGSKKKKKSASRAPARPAPLLRAGLHANCFSPLGLLPPSSVTAKALLVASTPPCDLSPADLCARPPAALRTATRLRTSAAQRSARASCAPRSGPALARRGAFTRLFPLPGTPFPTFPRAPRHASLRSQLSPLPPDLVFITLPHPGIRSRVNELVWAGCPASLADR